MDSVKAKIKAMGPCFQFATGGFVPFGEFFRPKKLFATLHRKRMLEENQWFLRCTGPPSPQTEFSIKLEQLQNLHEQAGELG